MIKCGEKFCSKIGIKTNEDARKCVETVLKDRPTWKGACFYKKGGAGCDECGGRVIRASACKMCVECGASSCG